MFGPDIFGLVSSTFDNCYSGLFRKPATQIYLWLRQGVTRKSKGSAVLISIVADWHSSTCTSTKYASRLAKAQRIRSAILFFLTTPADTMECHDLYE